ncbi:phage integrase SAM-like domain-containing protein [Larkinella insperata]|uniref:Phage integrase SAM-like domain-containing protein n=1 Tax=Larkinella insperata TaxID=332158 RepID=A0ABW3QFE2_9BACT
MDQLTTYPALPLRQRVSLRLMFELTPGRKTALAELKCRLQVDEQPLETYGSGVFTPPGLWDPRRQRAKGRSAEARAINQLLSDIRAGHLVVLQELVRAELPLTAAQVRYFWTTGAPIAPRLLHLFEAYVTALEARPQPERPSRSTMGSWQLSYRYASSFLNAQGHRDLLLPSVGVGWAKAYYQWLRARPLSVNFSTSLVGNVREVLQFAVENELLADNPLKSLKLGWKYGKPIHCLSRTQLQTLHTLELPRSLDVARQWALFCCYTGLDYADAIALMTDPDPHLHRGSYGEKIIWQRLKIQNLHEAYPQWAICHIPLLEEARQLLAGLRSLRQPSFNRMNHNLKLVGNHLQLPFRFTTKVCRKTAGALFIHRGYRMPVIQKIMGVKNYSTLEKHYLTTWSEVVDNDMIRLNEWEQELPASSGQVQ